MDSIQHILKFAVIFQTDTVCKEELAFAFADLISHKRSIIAYELETYLEENKLTEIESNIVMKVLDSVFSLPPDWITSIEEPAVIGPRTSALVIQYLKKNDQTLPNLVFRNFMDFIPENEKQSIGDMIINLGDGYIKPELSS